MTILVVPPGATVVEITEHSLEVETRFAYWKRVLPPDAGIVIANSLGTVCRRPAGTDRPASEVVTDSAVHGSPRADGRDFCLVDLVPAPPFNEFPVGGVSLTFGPRLRVPLSDIDNIVAVLDGDCLMTWDGRSHSSESFATASVPAGRWTKCVARQKIKLGAVPAFRLTAVFAGRRA